MKLKLNKKHIIATTMVFASGIAAFNINLAENENIQLSFSNIEALATGEDNTPKINCPGGKSTCASVTDSSGTRTFYKR